MLWAGSEASQIYLSQTRAGVWLKSGTDQVHWLPATSAQDGWRQGIELLRHGGKPKRQRLTVWLSGALARPFVLESVQGLRKRSEAFQVAMGLASETTGLPGPCEIWLDHWVLDKPCIAVAIAQELREAIESSAREEKLHLTAIRPWWGAALNAAVKIQGAAPGLLAVEEADALTVLSGGADVLSGAATYSPRPDPAQTSGLLTRALMASSMKPAISCRATLIDAPLPTADAESTARRADVFPVRLEEIA